MGNKEDDSQTVYTTSNGEPADVADSSRRVAYREQRLEESHPKPPEQRGPSSAKARPSSATPLYGDYYLPPMYSPYGTSYMGSQQYLPLLQFGRSAASSTTCVEPHCSSSSSSVPPPTFNRRWEDMYMRPPTTSHGWYNGTEDDGTRTARTGTNKTNPYKLPYRRHGSVYDGHIPSYYQRDPYGHNMFAIEAYPNTRGEGNPRSAYRYNDGSTVAEATKQQKVGFHKEPSSTVGDAESFYEPRRRRAYMKHLEHVTDSSGRLMSPAGAKIKQPHDKSTAVSYGKNDSVVGLVSRSRGKLYVSESEDEDSD